MIEGRGRKLERDSDERSSSYKFTESDNNWEPVGRLRRDGKFPERANSGKAVSNSEKLVDASPIEDDNKTKVVKLTRPKKGLEKVSISIDVEKMPLSKICVRSYTKMTEHLEPKATKDATKATASRSNKAIKTHVKHS